MKELTVAVDCTVEAAGCTAEMVGYTVEIEILAVVECSVVGSNLAEIKNNSEQID